MPPRRFSRYSLSTAVRDEEGDLVLYGGRPFRYQLYADNVEHVVKEGETLFTLAARYYASLPRPARFWSVIADFQPDPIHDPTLVLEPGRVLYIPSVRTLTEVIFSERRRRETEA